MIARHAPAAAILTGAARMAAPLARSCATRIRGAGRALFLTFDDGPHPDCTRRLLDVLEEQESEAAFFLVGERVRRQPALARQIVDAGHTVGQHTDTHIDPWRSRPSTTKSEMERATAAIEDATGCGVAWMRPPYGHVTPGIVRWARENRQRIALWDVMPGDFLASATSERVARHVERAARPGSIVVLHDGARLAEITPPAVQRILRSARTKGFRCARL